MAKQRPRKIHFQRFPTDVQSLVLSKLERPEDFANAICALAHPGNVRGSLAQKDAHRFVERFVLSEESSLWRPVMRASLDETGVAGFYRLQKSLAQPAAGPGFRITPGQLAPIRTAIKWRAEESEVQDLEKNARLDADLLLFNRMGFYRQGWDAWSDGPRSAAYTKIAEAYVSIGKDRCVGVADKMGRVPQEMGLRRPLNFPQQLAIDALENVMQLMASLRIRLVIDITVSDVTYEGMFHFPHSAEVSKDNERVAARFVACMIFDHRRCNRCAGARDGLEYDLPSDGALVYNVWGADRVEIDSWRGTDPKNGKLLDSETSHNLLRQGLQNHITNIAHPSNREHKLEVWDCSGSVEIGLKELGCPILTEPIYLGVDEDILDEDDDDSLLVKIDWGGLFRILLCQQMTTPSTLTFGFVQDECVEKDWFNWMRGCSTIPSARFGAKMLELLGGKGRKKRKRGVENIL